MKEWSKRTILLGA